MKLKIIASGNTIPQASESVSENRSAPDQKPMTLTNFAEGVPAGSTIADAAERQAFLSENTPAIMASMKDKALTMITAMGIPAELAKQQLDNDPTVQAQFMKDIQALGVIKTPDGNAMPVSLPKGFEMHSLSDSGVISIISKTPQVPAGSRQATDNERSAFLDKKKPEVTKEAEPQIRMMMSMLLKSQLQNEHPKMTAEEIETKSKETLEQRVQEKLSEIVDGALMHMQIAVTPDGPMLLENLPARLTLDAITADGKVILTASEKATPSASPKLAPGTQLLKNLVPASNYQKLRTQFLKKAEQAGLPIPPNFELVTKPGSNPSEMEIMPYAQIPEGHILTDIQPDGTPVFEKGEPVVYDSADEIEDPEIREDYIQTRATMTTMAKVLNAWVRAKPNAEIDKKVVGLIAVTEEYDNKSIHELSIPYQDALRSIKHLISESRTENGENAWQDNFKTPRGKNAKADAAFKARFQAVQDNMLSKKAVMDAYKTKRTTMRAEDKEDFFSCLKTLSVLEAQGKPTYDSNFQDILTRMKSTLDNEFSHFYS